MIREIPILEPEIDAGFETSEAEQQKESLLQGFITRISKFRENATAIYFDNKLDVFLRNKLGGTDKRGTIAMVESVLGRPREEFNWKKASFRFSIGVFAVLKDMLDNTDPEKIDEKSPFGKVLSAAKGLLDTEEVNALFERIIQKEIK